MSDNRPTQVKKHTIVIENRKKMSLDGIKDVVSFDDGEVVLITEYGEMTVEGRELHISVLDILGGVVELDGNVDAVYYTDDNEEKNKPKGFFGRVFS